MMLPEITNDNLYLLLPGKVSAVAAFFADEFGCAPMDALRAFYHSDTFKSLEQEDTKYWHYGPVALYQEFKEGLERESEEE